MKKMNLKKKIKISYYFFDFLLMQTHKQREIVQNKMLNIQLKAQQTKSGQKKTNQKCSET